MIVHAAGPFLPAQSEPFTRNSCDILVAAQKGLPMSRLYAVFHDYWNLCIGIAVATAALLLSKDKILSIYTTDVVHAVLISLLMLMSVTWLVLYLHATRNEIDLLEVSFTLNYRPQGAVLPIGIMLAIVFGALIAFASDVIVFASIAIVACLVDAWGQNNVNINMVKLYQKKLYPPDQAARATIIFDYYLTNPTLFRVTCLVVAFCGALVLGVIWHFTHIAKLMYIAYVVMLTAGLVSEFTLFRWRRARDFALLKAESATPSS
jgi:hypothetical protein